MKEIIHRRLVERRKQVDDWFDAKSADLDFPVYASVDIRDGGVKIASVDANIFPAGFNNVCDVDQETDKGLLKKYLTHHYGRSDLRILLLTEEHTANKYYWENVKTLRDLLINAGADARVGVPKEFTGTFEITTPKGHVVQVFSAKREGDHIQLGDGFQPDLIVSNNDFSNPHNEWFAGLKTPMNPSHELGWFRRKKSDHFIHYNRLAEEFCRLLDVDPWALTVKTQSAEVDFNSQESIDRLAAATQKFIDEICVEYKARGKGCSAPVVFVKNNSGTYGMGIVSVRSGEELRQLSSKELKKMGYAKGGNVVHEVVLQEGIPTLVTGSEGETAEPAIYMIGCQLAGGFLRAHKQKGPIDNLNSPGAVFKRLCMSDLMVDIEGSRLENVYGWVARLNMLAIGLESKAVGAHYRASN